MKAKWKAVLCCILVLLTCTGCTGLFAAPLSLMHPPQAGGDMYGLESALFASAGNDITFVYPSSGEYRTSSVTVDLDSDGQDEVLVFYTDDKSQLYMNFLRKQDNAWESAGSILLGGVAVDCVSFADLCGNGNSEVLVGCILQSNREKQLTVFQMNDGALKPVTQTSYNAYKVCNLTGDSKDQLLLASMSTVAASNSYNGIVSKSANAQLISLNSESVAMTVLGITQLDSNITGFVSIQQAPLNSKRNAVYIDANIGNSMITELIYYRKGQLYNAFYDKKSQVNTVTLRETSITCTDIDTDGYLEIPQTDMMFGYSDQNSDIQYFYSWKKFDGKKLNNSITTVSPTGEYHLRVKRKWIGNVTVKKDTAMKSCVFYEWDNSRFSIGKKLFTIRAFSSRHWATKNKKVWKKLKKSNDWIYAVRVHNTNSKYSMTDTKIKQNFSISSQG